MEIDRRVRAKEFMRSLSIGKTKFYGMIKKGQIPKPIKASDRDVFWHESDVRRKVEEFKTNNDTIAHI